MRALRVLWPLGSAASRLRTWPVSFGRLRLPREAPASLGTVRFGGGGGGGWAGGSRGPLAGPVITCVKFRCVIPPYVRYACLASRQCYMYVPTRTTRIQCCVPSLYSLLSCVSRCFAFIDSDRFFCRRGGAATAVALLLTAGPAAAGTSRLDMGCCCSCGSAEDEDDETFDPLIESGERRRPPVARSLASAADRRKAADAALARAATHCAIFARSSRPQKQQRHVGGKPSGRLPLDGHR